MDGAIGALQSAEYALPAGFPALDRAVGICTLPAMDLSTFRDMDPHLLVGLVNTELRNRCESLDDLVKTHGLEQEALVEKLGAASYEYQPGQNQFR